MFTRQKWLLFITLIFILTELECGAATHYVAPTNPAAADPYTNWATAGTNIIDVVNAAMTGSATRVIWVTNGVYSLTNHIYVTNALTIKSVNGRDVTILTRASGTNRCAYFTGNSGGSYFDGFTVTNFITTNLIGSGIYGISSSIIRNCLFAGNRAMSGGSAGALYMNDNATVTNCIFRDNYAAVSGGAIYAADENGITISGCLFENNTGPTTGGGALYLYFVSNSIVSNCVVINNRTSGYGFGGGISIRGKGNNIFVDCLITGNVVDCSGSTRWGWGGGIAAFGPVTIKNCSIIGNTSTNLGGGIWGTNLTIRNCLITLNRASTNIGGGVWLTNSTIESCTVVSNYAGVVGGGLYINSAGWGTNNVIYFNTAASAANFTNTTGNTGLDYSCVSPAVDGTGNITNDPSLIDLAGGNYRLRNNSPCINTGTNQNWMTNSIDLDNRIRIRYGTVDMGAYETIYEGTIYRLGF